MYRISISGSGVDKDTALGIFEEAVRKLRAATGEDGDPPTGALSGGPDLSLVASAVDVDRDYEAEEAAAKAAAEAQEATPEP